MRRWLNKEKSNPLKKLTPWKNAWEENNASGEKVKENKIETVEKTEKGGKIEEKLSKFIENELDNPETKSPIRGKLLTDLYPEKTVQNKSFVSLYSLPWYMTILLYPLFQVRYLANIVERFSYFSRIENLWKCFPKIRSLKIIMKKIWDEQKFCMSV